MRTYFDSSALVAAMVEEEEHHAAALKALAEATPGRWPTGRRGETWEA
jgi:predicted nucleic acid-binding protein